VAFSRIIQSFCIFLAKVNLPDNKFAEDQQKTQPEIVQFYVFNRVSVWVFRWDIVEYRVGNYVSV